MKRRTLFLTLIILLASFPMPGEAAHGLRAAGLERETAFSVFNLALAVSLTLLCGLSVGLGWVGSFAAMRRDFRLMGPGIAFSAGAMTCLGLSAAAENLSWKTVAAAFLGAAFMLLAELSLKAGKRPAVDGHEKRPVGAASALAVALHNLPECFIVFSSAMEGSGLGLALGGAMVAHNIPLGMAIALSSGQDLRPSRNWEYAALAGIIPPLAAMSAYFFLRPLLTPDIVQLLFAGAGGALVFIALTKLVPLARRHVGRAAALAGFAGGVLLLLLILMVSHGTL